MSEGQNCEAGKMSAVLLIISAPSASVSQKLAAALALMFKLWSSCADQKEVF